MTKKKKYTLIETDTLDNLRQTQTEFESLEIRATYAEHQLEQVLSNNHRDIKVVFICSRTETSFTPFIQEETVTLDEEIRDNLIKYAQQAENIMHSKRKEIITKGKQNLSADIKCAMAGHSNGKAIRLIKEIISKYL